MVKPIAVLDACVIYSAPLRDLLMHLALTDLYQPKWTHEIHREWIDAVRTNRSDISLAQLERTRDLMNAHIQDCLVIDFEDHVPHIELPDVNDGHVVAAALHSGSSHIITFNLSDFPSSVLSNYQIAAIHPDRFVMELLRSSTEDACLAVHRQRQSLRNPPRTAADLLQTFKEIGLVETAAELLRFVELL